MWLLTMKQVVVADAGDAAAFFGADVDGDGLAEGVAVADLQRGWRRPCTSCPAGRCR